MARIYVASSWRNEYQPEVCKWLRDAGHELYDFRNPPGKAAFAWRDVEADWTQWSKEKYREILTTDEKTAHGFIADFRGMMWADICVLVLPCGRSAHLEAGWFVGANKPLIIFMPYLEEPDLMYLLGQALTFTKSELLTAI